MEGPAEPAARIDAICASIHRLAPFKPGAVVCLTGPGDDRDIVVDGLADDRRRSRARWVCASASSRSTESAVRTGR